MITLKAEVERVLIECQDDPYSELSHKLQEVLNVDYPEDELLMYIEICDEQYPYGAEPPF